MSTNVRAAYFVANATAVRMIEGKRGGVIINVSSHMGMLEGSTDDLRRWQACDRGSDEVEGDRTRAAAIRVNAIPPTSIRTPLIESTFADPERRAWTESKTNLGRMGQARNIIGAVVFLASDAAAMGLRR
jgi:2-deoxy-D-gluconate 3-dehydrogenase